MKRVGTFFILLGILLVGLYVLSDIAKSPTFWLLVVGGLGIGLGVGMNLSSSKSDAPQESGRFRLIKQIKNPPPKKPKGSRKWFWFNFGRKKEVEPDLPPAERGKEEKREQRSPRRSSR